MTHAGPYVNEGRLTAAEGPPCVLGTLPFGTVRE